MAISLLSYNFIESYSLATCYRYVKALWTNSDIVNEGLRVTISLYGHNIVIGRNSFFVNSAVRARVSCVTHHLFLHARLKARRRMPAKRKAAAASSAAPAPPLNLQERINEHSLGLMQLPVSSIRVLEEYLARRPSTPRWMHLSTKMRGNEGWNHGHNLLVVQLPSVCTHTHTQHTRGNTLHTNTYTDNAQTPTEIATSAPTGNADRPIDNRGVRSDAART